MLTDEGHVNGNHKNNWLRKEDSHGSADVSDDKLFEVNFNLFLLSVDSPVLSAPPQLRSFADENDRWVCFFMKENQKDEACPAHDAADVFCPTPSEVTLCDKASNERSEQRAHEHSG